MAERDICGEVIDLHHDSKITKLNVQLVHEGGDVKNGEGCHLIRLENWSKETPKILVTPHIKDAIRLKSVIDGLVYDALTEPDV